jgi:hypothetical protein|tara:strand:+ start:11141 stop:11296 length:156 start_codon:yes stop_codon:yes gene_type:complete
MVMSPEICGFEELFNVAYLIWGYGDKIQAILHFILIVVNSHNALKDQQTLK